MKRFIVGLLGRATLPIERKMLKGVSIGIGMSQGGLDTFFLKDRLAALQRAIERREAKSVVLTGLQVTWIMTDPARRGSYGQLGAETFPDASCYVVMALEETTIRFGVYGAAFDPLLEGSADAVLSAAFNTLDDYFDDVLFKHIAAMMNDYPEAFSGQLWYPPEATRRDVKKKFTLPPNFK